MSQETDAIIVLVSEEVGAVSLAVDGNMSQRLDAKQLRLMLREFLTTDNKATEEVVEAST